MPLTIQASAPGSLMLLGEHAVLHGRLAAITAVDRRLAVRVTPRKDSAVRIRSALGEHATELSRIEPADPFRFVLTALKQESSHFKTGLDLEIESQFPHNIGFGSSAAVTVATIGALRALRGKEPESAAVLADGIRVIRSVQGLGSGADVAASVHGGMLTYRSEPQEIEALASRHPLTAVYSGSKMPTAQVVQFVAARRLEFPHLFDEIYDVMERCAMDAFDAIAHQDWPTLGRLLNIAQGLMEAIGVSNARLAGIAYELREDPGILGAKISGSGLGDCVVGLGSLSRPAFPYEVIPVNVSPEGLLVEEV